MLKPTWAQITAALINPIAGIWFCSGAGSSQEYDTRRQGHGLESSSSRR